MAKLDISQLTQAANANARGVAGATKDPPAPAPAAKSKPKKPRTTPPAAASAARASTSAARKAANKRREGTVRLSLDIAEEDAEAFRQFVKARRHSQETVFRAALQMLLRADRNDYLDIVEALPPK